MSLEKTTQVIKDAVKDIDEVLSYIYKHYSTDSSMDFKEISPSLEAIRGSLLRIADQI